MFSHAVQACGTAGMSPCLCALSLPSEELLLIPALSIPSRSPAVGGSGKIPAPVSRDQRGAASGKCGKSETGSGAGAGVEVGGVGCYTWRLEGLKASNE